MNASTRNLSSTSPPRRFPGTERRSEIFRERLYEFRETPDSSLGTPVHSTRMLNPHLYGKVKTFLAQDILSYENEFLASHLFSGTNVPGGVALPLLIPNMLAAWRTPTPSVDGDRCNIFSAAAIPCSIDECNEYIYDLYTTLKRPERFALSEVFTFIAQLLRDLSDYIPDEAKPPVI